MSLFLQVKPSERVVVSTPGYLKNLTKILADEPKRNVANYMIWRATRASLGKRYQSYIRKIKAALIHSLILC